jgi:hypothetical protein
MTTYALYKTATGQVIQTVTQPFGLPEVPPGLSGHAYVEVDDAFSDADGYISNGATVKFPMRPSASHAFDWTAKQWFDPRTLQDLKDAQWEEVKRWRAAAGVEPLMQTRFGIFDAATKDMANIKDTVAGLTAAAALGSEPASIRWTMADENPDRYVTLTPNELREVGVMLLSRGNAAHEHSRALYDQIEAALTPEEVALVIW